MKILVTLLLFFQIVNQPNAGYLRVRPQRTYSTAGTYALGDVVLDEGAYYVLLTEGKNIDPTTNPMVWMKLPHTEVPPRLIVWGYFTIPQRVLTVQKVELPAQFTGATSYTCDNTNPVDLLITPPTLGVEVAHSKKLRFKNNDGFSFFVAGDPGSYTYLCAGS